MIKSIELGWLQKHTKWIPYPNIYFADCSKYNYDSGDVLGTYYKPTYCEMYFKNDIINFEKGIIIIYVYKEIETYLKEAIAHEWYHHIEYCEGIKHNDKKNVGYYERTEEILARKFELKMCGIRDTDDPVKQKLYKSTKKFFFKKFARTNNLSNVKLSALMRGITK